MSVIVMGMEMPEEGTVIAIYKLNGKFYASLHGTELCPIVPLPEKHGRLIDGDELADGCDGPHWCRWLSEIEDMPTIVEAEGEYG